MGLASLFRSRNFRRITAARLLFKAGRALVRGQRRTGLVLLGAAAVATRSTALAFLVEGALWVSRRAGRREVEGPERVPRRARLGGPGGR